MASRSAAENMTGMKCFFLLADTMLAGDGSSRLYAQPQDVFRQGHRSLLLAFDAAVVQHQGMEISIACMKDVGHAQAGFGAQAVDLAQDPGKAVRGMTPSCTR